MRILFTGATSVAGRVWYSRLRAEGHEVVGVSRQPAPGPAHQWAQVDLAHEDAAERLPTTRFDALIHFAAGMTSNEFTSEWYGEARTAVRATARVLAWASGRVGRVVLSSSCAIYGAQKVYTPTDEQHPLRPDTAYAVSKYAQEQLLLAFSASEKVPLAVLRLGYVYGPDVGADRAVSILARKVSLGEPVRLVNSRTAGLHLIHQDDIAAIGDVLLRDGDGVYNVVMPRHVSLWEYVETAMQVTGRRTEVTCHDDPEALVDNWYVCRPLVEKHGVRPAVPLATGIESVLRGLSHRGQRS